MSNELDKLRKVIAERTTGDWKLAKEKYITKEYSCIDTGEEGTVKIKHQYGNEWNNACFIATMGTHCELIMAVIDAADKANKATNDVGFSVGEAREKLCIDVLYRMLDLEKALTALKQALGEK